MPNAPLRCLNAWTALEVLAPETFKKAAELATAYNGQLQSLDEALLPWEKEVVPPKGFRFYYHVVLATLSYEPAVYALLDKYGDERPERPRIAGEVILGAVLLDSQGRLAGLEPVVISSFGWGFPIAIKGELRELAGWIC